MTNDQQLSSKKRHKRLAYGPNYIPEEETIRNDYSLNYVLTGSRPQNHIQNTALNTRFVEYPKLKKLLQLKTSLVSSHAHPPTYIQADLRTDRGGEDSSFNLLDLTPARFDVILIDPPLKEYIETYPHLASNPSTANCGGPQGAERDYWDWDELERLPLPQIAASPGFIFLWCGSGQGSTLERGRALLTKWGYRKCEDLVWIKTNHTTPHQQQQQNSPPNAIPAVFTPTKEHCLMGIRGTVRRSTDGHFVHCNVDTDVIVSEPDPTDPLHKPEELYQLIENFCLGRRRLELFGSSRCLRPGWLTIGTDCAPPAKAEDPDVPLDLQQRPVPYSKTEYLAHFLDSAGRTHNLLPSLAALPLAHGMVMGYPVPGGMPILGPGGTILATTISGRNTVSHPSGGLGRGPGNALLPGMRVSGLRDSSNQQGNANSSSRGNPQISSYHYSHHHHPAFVAHPAPTLIHHPHSYPFLHAHPHYPSPQPWSVHPQFVYTQHHQHPHHQQQAQHHHHQHHSQGAMYGHPGQPIYYSPHPQQSVHASSQQYATPYHQQPAPPGHPSSSTTPSHLDPAQNWTPQHNQAPQPFYPSYPIHLPPSDFFPPPSIPSGPPNPHLPLNQQLPHQSQTLSQQQQQQQQQQPQSQSKQQPRQEQ
ncbi:hypothetical protein PCASD_10298 [Puccinia coronata f. sp. avenae]|uniref:Uncharacterized protein n=1 Tax=Puccinia coronata f. sp. avenae TaxID=200324 RepID=A0A2N5U7G8_9BASI|nr:hypothetical protein PCASD_10298 [Puccinia coronata f. sp. avenae]